MAVSKSDLTEWLQNLKEPEVFNEKLSAAVAVADPQKISYILFAAVYHKNISFMEKAITSGAHVNIVATPPKNRRQPLINFAFYRLQKARASNRSIDEDTVIVRCLIENGAFPHHLAKLFEEMICCLDLKGIEDLLNCGASVNSRDGEGHSPLHIAVRASYKPAIRLLLKKGADPNFQNKAGCTPLHCAVFTKDPTIVQFLFEKTTNLNLNLREKNGYTALHLAVAIQNNAMVNLLLENGASINPRNAADLTPLHTAVNQTQNIETVKILLQHGASVNAYELFGKTPLHFAVTRRNREMVKLLIQHGADIHAKHSWTALSNDTPLRRAPTRQDRKQMLQWEEEFERNQKPFLVDSSENKVESSEKDTSHKKSFLDHFKKKPKRFTTVDSSESPENQKSSGHKKHNL